MSLGRCIRFRIKLILCLLFKTLFTLSLSNLFLIALFLLAFLSLIFFLCLFVTSIFLYYVDLYLLYSVSIRCTSNSHSSSYLIILLVFTY